MMLTLTPIVQEIDPGFRNVLEDDDDIPNAHIDLHDDANVTETIEDVPELTAPRGKEEVKENYSSPSAFVPTEIVSSVQIEDEPKPNEDSATNPIGPFGVTVL